MISNLVAKIYAQLFFTVLYDRKQVIQISQNQILQHEELINFINIRTMISHINSKKTIIVHEYRHQFAKI
jgi:hypothetical protein